MKRPLFYAFLFFVVGILFGKTFTSNMFMFLIIMFSLCFFLAKKINSYILVIFFLISILGFIHVNEKIKPKNLYLENLSLREQGVSLEGIVENISLSQSLRQNIIIKVDKITANNIGKNIDFKVYSSTDTMLEIGQKLRLTGKLERFETARNPGGFNELLYRRTRNIDYKIFPENIEILEIKNTLNSNLRKLRDEFSYVYDNSLPKKEAGIIKSMILGDKSSLDDYTAQLYRTAGIYHIIAISGLHISILSGVINKILSLILNKKATAIITLVILVFYCIFTGHSVSTVRASLMAGVIVIGDLIYRKSDALTSVSFAGFILLIYQPLYLWDVGFIYSFTAVYSLIIGTDSVNKILSYLKRKSSSTSIVKLLNSKFIKSYFSSSLAVFLFTIPITSYFFYNITPYSIFANLLVVPTLCITTALGFSLGIIGMFSLEFSKFFSGILFIMLKFYEIVCLFFSKLPFAIILTGKTSIISISFWILVLVFGILYLNTAIRKYINFSIVSATIVFISFYFQKFRPINDLIFLDVGQGDSAVFSNSKETYIIDGGGRLRTPIGSNTGEKILIPYLNYKGIRKIDAVFISHFDFDHMAGILELIDKKEVKKIYVSSSTNKEDKLFKSLEEKTSNYNIEVVFLDSDDIVKGKNIYFECIYPFEDITPESKNNQSLVLKADILNTKILFTGDIELEAENNIVKNHKKVLSSNILKIAHHGSNTSTSKGFLELVSPDISIISVGKYNSYGHPSKETLEKLDNINSKTYTTSKNGAITISFYKNKITLDSMLK